MKRTQFLSIALLLLLGSPVRSSEPAASPVTVIHDAGGESLKPYLEDRDGTSSVGQRAPRPIAPPARVDIFPVRSSSAGPGRLLRNPMPSKLPGGPGQALFVVGSDPLSMEWLRRNADLLRQLHARGIVASVETQADFVQMRAMTDLQMVPMSADALLEAAGIHVWPVLIGADGSISQ